MQLSSTNTYRAQDRKVYSNGVNGLEKWVPKSVRAGMRNRMQLIVALCSSDLDSGTVLRPMYKPVFHVLVGTPSFTARLTLQICQCFIEIYPASSGPLLTGR